jgi:hypothetical protein
MKSISNVVGRPAMTWMIGFLQFLFLVLNSVSPSDIKIYPNCQQFRAEETHGGGVRRAAGMLPSQPVLALAGIVIPEKSCGPYKPAGAESIAKLDAHARILRDVANIAGFRSMLGNEPELLSNPSVSHGSAARLSCFAADGFQKRIRRRENSQDKQELDGGIQNILLEEMNDAVFHCFFAPE